MICIKRKVFFQTLSDRNLAKRLYIGFPGDNFDTKKALDVVDQSGHYTDDIAENMRNFIKQYKINLAKDANIPDCKIDKSI